ncbi:Glycosyltransferase involved in cell wall bisynthesis (RfaB) [Fructobacillus evanidus]|uniref:glycosyltransferase n=1 Tax=Fructobacillus evanidus TaxID=3064281 RepID=UPI002DA55C14|nr:Glycosyltransferase involved in cell wall bisynthesis (RfaB) [Fructobacillus sp. LMG 32999]
MNFFVTYNYASNLSGIEHAQIKRNLALKKFGYDSKFVSLAYNRFLKRESIQSGVEYNNLINMYDYFQGVSSIDDSNNITPRTLYDEVNDDEYIVNINKNKLEINNSDNTHIKNIYLMWDKGTNNKIDKIEYFDKYHNIVRIDYFDVRGFLSMSDIMGQQGGVSREINYDYRGDSILESFYHIDEQGDVKVRWMLKYKDEVYWFSKKEMLEAKFLDYLNQDFQENNIFISDRAYLTDNSLINMSSFRKLFIFWHNVFVPEDGIPNFSKPFDTLLNEIEHKNKITGLLAATNKEVMDLENAVQGQIKVFKMNSFVKLQNIDASKKMNLKEYDIITVSRISPEKRLLLGVEIFSKIHKELPQVHWDIFGYGDQNYVELLKNIIADKGLSKAITIHEYTFDLKSVYENAKIFWMLSKFEGFNMSQAEAQTYGIPTIAFDIDYGPSELIKNEENGYLIENNDTYNFYIMTKKLLLSPQKMEYMSRCSRLETDKYLPNELIKQWKIIAEL